MLRESHFERCRDESLLRYYGPLEYMVDDWMVKMMYSRIAENERKIGRMQRRWIDAVIESTGLKIFHMKIPQE